MTLNLPELLDETLDFVHTDFPSRAAYHLGTIKDESRRVADLADQILGWASVEEPDLTAIANLANQIIQRTRPNG